MKKILMSLTIGAFLFADGCWNVKEDADMFDSELDDLIVFSFKDAVTCEPVSNAKVKFLGKISVTDENGQIKVSTPPDFVNGKLILQLHKKGYINFKQQVMASVGSYWNNKFLVSKGLPINSMRFVLSWDSKPRDLDLHLVGDDFHISYRKTKSVENVAKLDRDARNGYGAETITLNRVSNYKTYKVYIYNYSNEKSFSGKTNLAIYKNGKLDNNIAITSNSRCIEVASINNNKIDYNPHGVSDSFCK